MKSLKPKWAVPKSEKKTDQDGPGPKLCIFWGRAGLGSKFLFLFRAGPGLSEIIAMGAWSGPGLKNLAHADLYSLKDLFLVNIPQMS